jgi:hypothetical protein
VIRGGGFQHGGAPEVRFGGLAPTSFQVRSDTEIRAVPPPGLTAGRVAVTPAPNALGLARASAELVVRAAPVHPPATQEYFLFPARALYDAERDAVLASCPVSIGSGKVVRAAYDPATGTWPIQEAFFAGLMEIALTPDGKSLLVLCSSQMLYVDPVTLAVTDSADAGDEYGSGHQTVVTNSGQVVIAGMSTAFSLLDRTSRYLDLPPATDMADASADGSFAIMGYYDTTPMATYDASTDAAVTTSRLGYTAPVSLDRSASKILMGNTILSPALVKAGQVGASTSGASGNAVLSQDGTRVYIQDASTHAIRVFDVSGSGPDYPELPPVAIPDNGSSNYLLLSPDGKTLFSLGYNLIVHPL